VRVPEGAKTAFLVNWPTVREQETLAVQKYKVRRGDSLLAIARKHGVSVSEIQDANGIRGTRINAGQTIEIPGNV
jgi:membrane-bound lytic murein transglycosylase D